MMVMKITVKVGRKSIMIDISNKEFVSCFIEGFRKADNIGRSEYLLNLTFLLFIPQYKQVAFECLVGMAGILNERG